MYIFVWLLIFLPTLQFFHSTHPANLWVGLLYLVAVADLKGLVPVGRNNGWVHQCHFWTILFISSFSRPHISDSTCRRCLMFLRSFLTFTRCRAVLCTWREVVPYGTASQWCWDMQNWDPQSCLDQQNNFESSGCGTWKLGNWNLLRLN